MDNFLQLHLELKILHSEIFTINYFTSDQLITVATPILPLNTALLSSDSVFAHSAELRCHGSSYGHKSDITNPNMHIHKSTNPPPPHNIGYHLRWSDKIFHQALSAHSAELGCPGSSDTDTDTTVTADLFYICHFCHVLAGWTSGQVTRFHYSYFLFTVSD